MNPAEQSAQRAERVDDGFVESYAGACAAVVRTAPVIVVAGDLLVVFHDGKREEVSFASRELKILKSAAHAPVAVFALLHPGAGSPLSADARARLLGLARRIDDAAVACEGAASPDVVGRVLRITSAFGKQVLDDGLVALEALEAFAGTLESGLDELIARATQVELEALHARVDEIVERLPADARHALQVVVTGQHQARVRSLGMQYFQARFGEPAGADERVVYAESITDPDEAYALVGKRSMDLYLARAFFGDPKRLQRDVLGDAAAAAIVVLRPARIA